MPIATIAVTVLQLLPSLMQAGIDIAGILSSTNGVIARAQAEDRDPSDAEWSVLDQQISALRAQLNS